MSTKEKALEYLSRDYLLNIDMIECINRNTVKYFYAGDDGVLLTADDDYAYMLAADNAETAIRILRTVDFKVAVLHDTAMLQPVAEAFGLEYKGACLQAAYLGKNPLPESDADIRPLTQEHAQFVAEHNEMSDLEYIKGRIAADDMFGAFDGDTLMGFIGTHEEGSMGMLEVLPEYRRRGLALALEQYVINRTLSKGYVPYVQLYTTNAASKALQERLGLSFADKNIIWLWKPEN